MCWRFEIQQLSIPHLTKRVFLFECAKTANSSIAVPTFVVEEFILVAYFSVIPSKDTKMNLNLRSKAMIKNYE